MKGNGISKTMISKATVRNWKRLHSKSSGRLMSRANKQLSTKSVLPLEYFSNKENVADIQRFVSFCKKQNFKVEDAVFSVGVELLKKAGILEKEHVAAVLESLITLCSLSAQSSSLSLVLPPLPSDETDLLGLLYQCFLLEGEKNRKGSYYTPFSVARNMTKNLDFSKGQTFFDPCCGSGAFMMSLEGAKPSQIFGCDNDPIAVMIAKINLLLKFPDEVFEPQIVCCDFLNAPCAINAPKASYIISNPPWGAVIYDDKNNPIPTKESFSFFFEKAFQQLDDEGVIRFLLPESILNVKIHKNFRKFLLENTDIQSITRYLGTFSGVQTKYIDIESRRTRHALSPQDFIIENDFISSWDKACLIQKIKKSSFYLTKNLNLNLLSDSDLEKVQKILSKGKYTLKDSLWGLGIVTGNNKKHLKAKQGKGFEPIYTGKDIDAYTLKTPKRFIKYKRSEYQQVAKDEIYRAEEKLVYKFISKNLVFAYDDSKSLFLNSANILIPRIPGMSVKTVLAFLNSEMFIFLYKSLFGEIKILKGNLMELPFPEISVETDKKLTELVDKVLNGNKEAIKKIDSEIETIFGVM
ncbi:MAG: N-6 DNA methylase [Bacteroidales bacterium]|nr:N-6 DNA methylase [Bacteroidales bacterium]